MTRNLAIPLTEQTCSVFLCVDLKLWLEKMNREKENSIFKHLSCCLHLQTNCVFIKFRGRVGGNEEKKKNMLHLEKDVSLIGNSDFLILGCCLIILHSKFHCTRLISSSRRWKKNSSNSFFQPQFRVSMKSMMRHGIFFSF